MLKDIWKTMFSLTVLIPLFVLIYILYIPFRLIGIDLIKIVEDKINDVLR
jgi:hypothetical protein